MSHHVNRKNNEERLDILYPTGYNDDEVTSPHRAEIS